MFIVSHLILPQAIVDKLVLMGIQVVACIADNAANMKAVLRKLFEDKAAIPMHCLAHCGELLQKDLSDVWPAVHARASALESFFRLHHYPRLCYLEELQKRERSGDVGTLISRPVKTRWGSQSRLLVSLLENRELIESVLARLRREKYRDEDFTCLAWVWQGFVWDEFASLARITEEVAGFVTSIEGDQGSYCCPFLFHFP